MHACMHASSIGEFDYTVAQERRCRTTATTTDGRHDDDRRHDDGRRHDDDDRRHDDDGRRHDDGLLLRPSGGGRAGGTG